MTTNFVRLKVTKGLRDDKEYSFDRAWVCVVGRGSECFPQASEMNHHVEISRRHCLLAIAPPKIWIKDLGSLNGTYVNGFPLIPDDTPYELKDGDRVSLGNTVDFQIEIAAPAAVATKTARATASQTEPDCLNVAIKDNCIVVHFTGHMLYLKEDHLHSLHHQLARQIGDVKNIEVLVDFSNVEDLASAVLARFVRLYQELAAYDARFRLVGVPPHLYEVFEASNLHELFDIHQAQVVAGSST